MILCSSCATGVSSPSVCPPVPVYDRAMQTRLAAEIAALPQGAALERAMLDYASVRAQLKICGG